MALGPYSDCYGVAEDCPPGSNLVPNESSLDLQPLRTHSEHAAFDPATDPSISNPVEPSHYESEFLQQAPHQSMFHQAGDNKQDNSVLRLRGTLVDQTCSNRHPELNPTSQSLMFRSQEIKLQSSLSRPGEGGLHSSSGTRAWKHLFKREILSTLILQ